MKSCLFSALVILLSGCSGPSPPSTGKLIVLVADCRFVSREDFAADLQERRDQPLLQESVDLQYAAYLNEVAALQAEQIGILSDLIRDHDPPGVYFEGVTDENVDEFRARVQKLSQVDIGRMHRRNGKSENPEVIATAEELLRSYEKDLLRIGAAGRLVMANQLDDVLPLEKFLPKQDADSSQRRKPDGPQDEARTMEIVQRLIADGPVVVAVVEQPDVLQERITAACPTCRVQLMTPERLQRRNSAR